MCHSGVCVCVRARARAQVSVETPPTRRSGIGSEASSRVAEEACTQAQEVVLELVSAALGAKHRNEEDTAQLSGLPMSLLKMRQQLTASTAKLRAALRFKQHPPFSPPLLLAHQSARQLWTAATNQGSGGNIQATVCRVEWERLRKAFLACIRELSPTSKEVELFGRALLDPEPVPSSFAGGKQSPTISLVRLALFTDRWGVIGSFIRLTRSGPSFVLSFFFFLLVRRFG